MPSANMILIKFSRARPDRWTGCISPDRHQKAAIEGCRIGIYSVRGRSHAKFALGVAMDTFGWFWSGQAFFDVRLVTIVGIVLAFAVLTFAVLWRRGRRGEAERAKTAESEIARLSGELDRLGNELAASDRKIRELSDQVASYARDIDSAVKDPSSLAARYLRRYVEDLGASRERLEAGINESRGRFVAAVDSAAPADHLRAGFVRSVADVDLDSQRRRIEDLESEVDNIRSDAERATRLAAELGGNAFDAYAWKRRVDQLVGEAERAWPPSLRGVSW